MPLASGTQLGPYQILEAIGAGGMGEVYRAKDTRLDRTVAVKVLPAAVANRPEFRQRFEREARAVSSLNHPHICALYDVGHQDGIDFLVMEYLEGETLSARLSRGPLPAEQVLEYGIQIADALAQAHRKEVFHRDLKPGNIMLTRAGTKLLDFGLAKFGARPAVGAEGGVSALPTQDAPLTAVGTILGTFQYMAPEQIDGRETDGRTDIFAFGAILYEMATAKKAFEGRSHASVMAAILERDPPPVSSMQPMSPPAFDRAVRTCLEKEPDNRWQSARDLSRELKWIAETGLKGVAPEVAAAAAAAPAKPTRRPWLAWAAAAVCLLAAVGFAAAYFWRPAPEKRTVRFFVAPPAKAIIDTFKLSPDGRFIAMAADVQGKRSLWVRSLESLEPQALPGTDEARYPFWSPDSRYIGFFAQGKLKKTAVTGGPPQTLCDASDGRGGTWNRDGIIVFSPSPAGGLFRVAAAGGAPVAVTSPDPNGGGIHRFPEFLPDGRQFLYVVTLAKQQNGLHLSTLDSKESRLLLADQSSAAYALGPGGRGGYLLYAREGTLTAQPFDPSRGQFAGDPFPVAEQVGFANLNHAQLSVSADGSLVYLTGGGMSNLRLTWFDREGKQLGTAGQPGPIVNFALSPDEKRVAVERLETPTAADIWMVELARGAESRFTFDPSTDRTPIWSPDGSRVAFASTRAGRMDLYQKVSSGAGKDELLLQTGAYKQPTDWSRDGRFIAYREAAPKTRGDLWLLPLSGDRKPIPYLQTEFTEDDGRFSPDGRWMAYSSDEAGRMEVYIQPIPPSGAKWQISTTGGAQPRWRRDGKELFYLAPDRKLMVVGIQAGATIQASAPKPLFETRTLPPSISNPQLYEPTADGRRFLIATLAGESAATPLTVVVNWTPPRP